MIAWFSDIAEIKTLFLHLAERDAEITAQLARMNAVAGYCTACRQPSTFNVTAGHEQPGEWRNLLEGMQCPCGTNGRTRLAAGVLAGRTSSVPALRCFDLRTGDPTFFIDEGGR